jgi:dihydrofolate reductase
MSAASTEHVRALRARTGALIVGRHLYDFTNAWGGRHPMDVTTVVLTHKPPADRPVADENFVFVTGGIEEAVAKAQEIAGDREVGVNGGQMARQCLEAGLLDEVHVDLVPVLLGSGTPYFGQFAGSPLQLDGPVSVVEGTGVTHLRYLVRRPR